MLQAMGENGRDQSGAATADRFWRVLEPIHGVTYFMPEALEEATSVGLKGFWMTYFAFRAAPLGPVPASVVQATFFNFHRTRVERAIPDAWALASVEAVLAARRLAAGRSLRRLAAPAGVLQESSLLDEALSLLWEAAAAADCSGRALAAANKSLAVPSDPFEALWQAVTVMREFRGDGHIACLVHSGLDGPEALVMHAASGAVPAGILRFSRNWPDDEWAAAEARLAARGLFADGAATPAGLSLRAVIEADTNELAASPYLALGADRCDRLVELLLPLARALARSGELPSVNPIGLDLAEG
jgi:hypothetical protein